MFSGHSRFPHLERLRGKFRRGRLHRHFSVAGTTTQSLPGERLEARRLLALAPIDASQLEITTQEDLANPGSWNISFSRTDGTDAPMRLELRMTDVGLGWRTDTISSFDPDLDRETDGIQSFSSISTLTVVGGAGMDTIVLDETLGHLARAFEMDGAGGADRVEHRSNSDELYTSYQVEFNAYAHLVQLTRDGADATRQTRSLHDNAVEEFAFYGANDGSHSDLVVRTGSGEADRTAWQPGRFDLELASLLPGAVQRRVWYQNIPTNWLYTAGGGDSVTINDHGTAASGPKQRLFVSTEDEDDFLQVNLSGIQSSADLTLEGRGGFNRLEMYSVRDDAEIYSLTANSLDHQLSGTGQTNFCRFSEIRQIHLSAGKGNDSISADQSGPERFFDAITLYGQDGDDELEINVDDGESVWSVDGGKGKNAISTFFAASAPVPDDVAARVTLLQNRLGVEYVNAQGEAARPGSNIYLERLGTLYVVVPDDAVLAVYPGAQTSLLDQVNFEFTGAVAAEFRELAVADSTDFTLEAGSLQRLDVTNSSQGEQVAISAQEIAVSDAAGGRSAVSYSNAARLHVSTGEGNDTVTVAQTNAMVDLVLDTGAGDDQADITCPLGGAQGGGSCGGRRRYFSRRFAA